jgi:hypothetical protein
VRGSIGARGAQGAQGGTGPRGAQGAQGAKGALAAATHSGASVIFRAGTSETASVACPAGDIATGGGYQATGYLILDQNGPVGGTTTSGPAGWQITGIAQSGTQTVTVYAICSTGGAL